MAKDILILSKIIILGLMVTTIQSAYADSGLVRIQDEFGDEIGRYEGSYALLIGVGRYKNWQRLSNIRQNLNVLHQSLIEQGFKVEVVENPKTSMLEYEIEQFLAKHSKKVNSRLVIYFVGQAYTGVFKNQKKAYLLGTDSPKVSDKLKLYQNALSLEELQQRLDTVRNKHTLVILNTCVSGLPLARSKIKAYGSRYQSMNPVKQWLVICEHAKQKQNNDGGFPKQWIAGLNGEADGDGDGNITVSELAEFFQKTYADLQYIRVEDPQKKQGDVVFLATQSTVSSDSFINQFSFSDGNDLTEAREDEPPAGEVWQDPTLGLSFVWVEGGCYLMGSDETDSQRYQDEIPHETCVDGLWVGQYEVTQKHWNWVMQGSKPKFTAKDHYPVNQVSLTQIQTFIEKLTKITGERFRLPTEAEWEFIARGGTQFSHYWGEDLDKACRYENVRDVASMKSNSFFNSDYHYCNDGFARLAPVGSFRANPFGIYDLLGNVAEWTCSRYDASYSGAENRCYRGSDGEVVRVIRGGAWNTSPRQTRVSVRRYESPNYKQGGIGFRLIRVHRLSKVKEE